MAKTTTTKKKVAQKTTKPVIAKAKTKTIVEKKKPVSAKKTVTAKKVVKTPKKAAEPVKKVTAKKTEVKKPVAKVAAIETKKITKVKNKDKREKVMPRKKKKEVEEEVKTAADSKIIPPAIAGPLLQGKSVAHIKGYSKEELDHFKSIILDKRDEILEQLQNLQDQMYDPSTGEYINENSPYSLHMAEQGTDAMEREKTFLYAQRENKFLGYLEESLVRIENGTYGICIDCIDNPQHLCPTCPLIPAARLEAVPHSQLCVEIKKKQERFK